MHGILTPENETGFPSAEVEEFACISLFITLARILWAFNIESPDGKTIDRYRLV